jgi:hypothetical protein
MAEKDPLLNVSSEAQKILFDKFKEQARGFPIDVVLGAAINVVVNALRQTYSTRDAAGKRLDEIASNTKGILYSHYDSFGRKKGIFPFNQNIVMPLIDLSKND